MGDLLSPFAVDAEDLSLDACDFYGVTRPGRDDDYCDWSFLRTTHCAHCLGHYLDPDLEEASKL